MTIGEIVQNLDLLSPFNTAESWDNVGLLIGNKNADVQDVILTLECTSDIVDNASCGSLIISHHPLIFKAFKSLDFSNYQAALIEKIIKKDIAVIAMHTNFDKSHLNATFANEILGLNGKIDGFVFYSDYQNGFEQLCKSAKEALNLRYINTVTPKREVQKVAVICGSGADFIDKIDADVLITGDIKYHQAMNAKELGIGLIDATHYASERHFNKTLNALIKDFGVSTWLVDSKSPFEVL